ncbi:hypothetical protein [Streptosporangium roseum]|uniref:hypothetical protein n=1 Tax=Streptosporangium roseum TaxID=2001 RepID=UPI00331D54C2
MKDDESLVVAPAGLFRHEALATARLEGHAENGENGLDDQLRLPVWPVVAVLAALGSLLVMSLTMRTEVRVGLNVLTATSRTVTVVLPRDMTADRLRASRIIVTASGGEFRGSLTGMHARQLPGATVPVAVAEIETSADLSSSDGVRVRAVTGTRSLMSDVLETERSSAR